MQLFYLLSFVVAASYAVVLPQPAGPPEKYSNDVDATLASGLEAKPYQHGLNSQNNSTILVSLERQDNSEKSPQDNSESGSSPPPTTTPEKIDDNPFKKAELGSISLASTIDNVGDGIVNLPKDIKTAGDIIGGNAGNILIVYLRKAIYVNKALNDWAGGAGKAVVVALKSGLGDDGYSKVVLYLKGKAMKSAGEIHACFKAAVGAISAIRQNTGSVIQQMETIHLSFERIFYIYIKFFVVLLPQLERFAAGKTIHMLLSAVNTSLTKFIKTQQGLYNEATSVFEDSSAGLIQVFGWAGGS
ncbi:hypothetical protein BASA61_008361 [Batrachochytrium salamandrivorans]|nr:hypothetical protein BASA62_006689 [Batrachochytrium salamandrivorans]KAH6582795.1 hypothetical protein BASA61_008361 [Batrachochytrium salamandrivorans]